MDLIDFLYLLNIDVTIHMRSKDHGTRMRFYASVNCYEKTDNGLIGCLGNGLSPDKALKAMAGRLSGKVIVLKAGSKDTFDVPELTYGEGSDGY